MVSRRVLAVLLLIAVVVGLAAKAQVGGDIGAGDTIEGELTNRAPTATYTLAGETGDIVTIRLTSVDFDSYLQLLDDTGDLLAEDDDGGGGLDAQITSFKLPRDGAYTVLVTSARRHVSEDQIATGAFTLEVTGGSPESMSGGIEVGGTVTGRLSFLTPEVTYTLDGHAGDVIVISAVSRDFDSYLTLKGPDGDEIARDDDSGGSLNARIGPVNLPEDGSYTIVVSSFSASSDGGVTGTGEFQVTVSAADENLLAYDELIAGRISKDETVVAYSLQGEAGDSIIVTLVSSDLYTYMELAAASDPSEILASSQYYYDTAGSGSRIGPITLLEDGYYILTLGNYDDVGSGRFTLYAERVELTRLEYGDTTSLDIREDDAELYLSFEGQAGEAAHLWVESDNSIDTSLSVIGPGNFEVASDDDGGSGLNPEIDRLILDVDGLYYVLLQNLNAENGRVRVSLETITLPSLDSGAVRVRLSEENSEGVITFTGQAGQRARLTVRVLGLLGAAGEPYVTVRQGDTTLASASGTYVSNLSFEFVVSEDGPVHVTIEDSSYRRVSLEVTLEQGSGV